MSNSNQAVDTTQSPNVYIATQAWDKMSFAIKATDGEISGLGKCYIDQGEVVVEDILIFEQECSAAETTLSEEDLSRWLVQLVRAGGNPAEYKLWWHSHAKMGVFWSGTDNTNIKRTLRQPDWLLSIVGNHAGQYLARIDMWSPFECTFHGCPIQELKPFNYELKKAVEEEVKAKVKVKTYTTTVWTPNRGGTYTPGGALVIPGTVSQSQLPLAKDTVPQNPFGDDGYEEAWYRGRKNDWAEQWGG